MVKAAAGILQSEGPAEISKKLGEMLEEIGEGNLDELRAMAAAASNILGVATTPRGTYTATEITQAELHWPLPRTRQLEPPRPPPALGPARPRRPDAPLAQLGRPPAHEVAAR